jgi:CRP-like cAMP-binding protein
MVLLEGRVKIQSTSPDGKETILGFIEAGEIFGELTLLDPERPYGDFAETTTTCLVAAISRDAFLHALSQSPETTFRLTKLVGLRRLRIENRVKGMLFRSSRDRVLLVLEELAEQYGQRNGRGTQIGLKLSHQDLASLAGVTRETVTLSLGELQRSRLVHVDKRTITLLTNSTKPTESVASPRRDLGTAGQREGSVA